MGNESSQDPCSPQQSGASQDDSTDGPERNFPKRFSDVQTSYMKGQEFMEYLLKGFLTKLLKHVKGDVFLISKNSLLQVAPTNSCPPIEIQENLESPLSLSLFPEGETHRWSFLIIPSQKF